MEKELLLNKLNEVLATKSFSESVKEKIKNTISEAYDSYTKPRNKKKHFEQLINSFSFVNEFRINTRKQLNKREKISFILSDCTLGFVSFDRSLVAVVKEADEQNTIYHEMIHLTQSENAYYVDEKYHFSKLITKCLLEGEASYYDIDLLNNSQRKNTEVLKNLEGEDLIFTSKSSYPFYSMIYKFLLDIFGEDIMEKWKYNGFNNDIIPILKDKFEKKFSNGNFLFFYLILTKMLFEYYSKLKTRNSYFHTYYDKEISSQIQKIKERNSLLKQNVSEFTNIMEYCNKIIKEIEEINQFLEDDELLKKQFQNILKEQKKELEEYKQDVNCDKEVVDEWQHDIEVATIDDYKKILLRELDDYKEKFIKVRANQDGLYESIETQKTDYFCTIKAEAYLDEYYDFLFCYEAINDYLDDRSMNDFQIYKTNKNQK